MKSIDSLIAGLDKRLVERLDGIRLNTYCGGSGPLVVLVHGFPDSWISWRHQIPSLIRAGFTVVAIETRGYGESSSPSNFDAYTLQELSADIVSVIDYYGFESAHLVGHDWGGAQVFATAILHPERVSSVVSLAFTAPMYTESKPSELWAAAYKDELFYQSYFLEPGLAELELETDPLRSVRLFIYALSGDRPEGANGLVRPAGSVSLLEGLPDPIEFPSWLGDDELEYYGRAFSLNGFTGPLNRYRAQDLDVEQMRPFAEKTIDQPVLWLGGEVDPARWIVPGVDKYIDPVPRCTNVRGRHLLTGVGHWIQQEQPDAVSALLTEFLQEIQRSKSGVSERGVSRNESMRRMNSSSTGGGPQT